MMSGEEDSVDDDGLLSSRGFLETTPMSAIALLDASEVRRVCKTDDPE